MEAISNRIRYIFFRASLVDLIMFRMWGKPEFKDHDMSWQDWEVSMKLSYLLGHAGLKHTIIMPACLFRMESTLSVDEQRMIKRKSPVSTIIANL